MSSIRQRVRPSVIGPVLIGAGAVLGLCACGSGTGDSGVTLMRPAETAVPQGTADPRVRPAVEAYESFVRAVNEAQQHPVAPGSAVPAEADLAQYSFDPVRGEYEAFVAELQQGRLAYRGTPPESHVSVTEIDQDATPWPRVVLADCRTETGDWKAYDKSDDVVQPVVTAGVSAPSGLAVTMIFNEQRWGVQTVVADPKGTCAS